VADEKLDLELSEVEHFAKNRVWKQIAEDALSLALELSEKNDVLDPLTNPSEILVNQGKIAMAKWIVDLPRILSE
jgi:hypothetical protein